MAKYKLFSDSHGVSVSGAEDGGFHVGAKPVPSEHVLKILKKWNRVMGEDKPLRLERVDGK